MATVDVLSLESLKPVQRQLVARLARVRRRVRARLVVEGLAAVLAEAALAAAFSLWADHAMRLGVCRGGSDSL
jgi:hypothetical protein